MSELTAIQPKHEAKEKMKMPETTALVIHDASVAKSKYAMSATLATNTMSPYGIAHGAANVPKRSHGHRRLVHDCNLDFQISSLNQKFRGTVAAGSSRCGDSFGAPPPWPPPAKFILVR